MFKMGQSAKKILEGLKEAKKCKVNTSGWKNEQQGTTRGQDKTWTDLAIANLLLVVNGKQRNGDDVVHKGAGDVGCQKKRQGSWKSKLSHLSSLSKESHTMTLNKMSCHFFIMAAEENTQERQAGSLKAIHKPSLILTGFCWVVQRRIRLK